MKEEVKRREYSHMSDLINFDKKKKPGFYDGVYDLGLIKKGLQSQLKDYIEGKITADQLFRKKGEQNKSVDKANDISMKKKSVSGAIKLESNFGGEAGLNYDNSMKNNLLKRYSISGRAPKLNFKKDAIKEEYDDENINSSKEINAIYKAEKENKMKMKVKMKKKKRKKKWKKKRKKKKKKKWKKKLKKKKKKRRKKKRKKKKRKTKVMRKKIKIKTKIKRI